MTGKSESNKNHLVFAAIGLIIIVAVVAHAGLAISLFKTFSIKNLSYLTIGSVLVIIIFKVFVIKHLLRK